MGVGAGRDGVDCLDLSVREGDMASLGSLRGVEASVLISDRVTTASMAFMASSLDKTRL